MHVVIYLAMFWFQQILCSDPCTDYHYLYDDGSRSISCGSRSDMCDSHIEERWYKVITATGPLVMPEYPNEPPICGAVNAIWLNDNYPAASDGIVNLTACVANYDDECEDRFSIQVKNCTNFYAFYLVATKRCPERYCFGDGPCPTTPPSITAISPDATNGDVTTTASLIPTQPTVSENDASMTTGLVLVILGACLLTAAAVLAIIVFIKRRQWKKAAVADSKRQPVPNLSSSPNQTP